MRVRPLLLLAAASLTTAATVAVPMSAASAAPPDKVTLVVVLDRDQRNPGQVGRELAQRHGGSLGFVYQHALQGFSISVPERAVQAVARDTRVASVERDQVFRTATASPEMPTGVARSFADMNTSLGIDGIDNQRVDVDVAVIDTGLDSDHSDLNIAGGTNCASGSWRSSSCTEGTFEDGNGHGTHVGGSVAALDNGEGVVGMAPGARLHGVKVLSDNGSGYTSWIIAGIDWVTSKADVIEVANMSLGCECSSTAQDQAIANSVAAGVTYVVAAGNSDKDASTFSPANHPDVITVSALADFDGAAGGLVTSATTATHCRADQDDTLADFSNFGLEVDIAAPGVCITSTWPGGAYNTISGTSMASPHVAGAAAVLASSRAQATPGEILSLLTGSGNADWSDDSVDGKKEPLLDVRDGNVFAPTLIATTTTTEPAPEPEPTNGITLSVTGAKSKGSKTATLTWSGTAGDIVDVHRNGAKIATTADGEGYQDVISTKGGGTYTYMVCEAGTSTCSNEDSVTF